MESAKFDMEVEYTINGKVEVVKIENIPFADIQKHIPASAQVEINRLQKVKSDGSTASYYELPDYAKELQHLISHKDMNAQIGEIFRACYRYGQASHSDQLRDAKKILFYAQHEVQRLEKKYGRDSS